MKLEISGADPLIKTAAYMILTPIAIGLETKEFYKNNPITSFFGKRKKKKLENLKEEEIQKKKQFLIEFVENHQLEHIEEEFIQELNQFSLNDSISNEMKEILHLNFAIEDLKSKLYKKSLLHCQEILKISTKNYFVFYLLSIIYNQLGESQLSKNSSMNSILFYDEIILSEKSKSIKDRMGNNSQSNEEKKVGFIKRKIQKFRDSKEEKKPGMLKRRLKKYKNNDIEEEEEDKDFEPIIRFIEENDLILHHLYNLLSLEYYMDVLDFINEYSEYFDNEFKYFITGICFYNLNEPLKALNSFEKSYKKDFKVEKSIQMIIMCCKKLSEFEKLNSYEKNHPNVKIPIFHLSLLSIDELNLIFQYLDIESLLSLSSTCKSYRKCICNSKMVGMMEYTNIQLNSKQLENLENNYLRYIYADSKMKRIYYFDFVIHLANLIYNCPFKFASIDMKKFPTIMSFILTSENKKWFFIINDDLNVENFNKCANVTKEHQIISKKDLILTLCDLEL